MKTCQSSWRRNCAEWGTTPTQSRTGLCGKPDPTVVEAASGRSNSAKARKGIADARGERRAGVVLFRPDSAGRRAVLQFVVGGSPGSHRWTLQVG